MGAANVSAAFLAMQGSTVPAPAKLVLLRMAHTARDADRPPLYWYGWEALAMSIGHTPDEVDGPARESIRRHVRRLVKALHDDGLIDRTDAAGNPISGGSDARIGHRQTYALRIHGARQGVTSDPPHPDTSDPPRGGSETSAVGVTPDPPKENSGELSGGARGEPASVERSSHQRAGEDGDVEYDKARNALDEVGPGIAQQAIEYARTHHRNASTREAVIHAARHLGGTAG